MRGFASVLQAQTRGAAGTALLGVRAMSEAQDDRDVLETLKAELDFIEKGGYGRSVRTPWKPTSIFQDSLTCFGFPHRLHDDCCLLMDFVPSEKRSASIPCHHIPLNATGETIENILEKGKESEGQEAVKEWLKATIQRLEAERAGEKAG